MILIKTVNVGGHCIRIFHDINYDWQDELANRPETSPNIITWHRRYDFNTKPEYAKVTPHEFQREYFSPPAQPIYALDHGGLIVSTGPFANKWDSGLLGYAFVDYPYQPQLYTLWNPTGKGHGVCHEDGQTFTEFLQGHLVAYVRRMADILNGDCYAVSVDCGPIQRGFTASDKTDEFGGALTWAQSQVKADIPTTTKRVRIIAQCTTEYTLDIAVPASMTNDAVMEYAKAHTDVGDYEEGAAEWTWERVETLDN